MTRLNLPLFVALAASLLSAVPVDGRDTLPHQRMIRKRGPAAAAPAIGAAAVIGLHVRQATDLLPTVSSASSSAAEASSTAAASTTAPTTSASSTSAAAVSTTSSAPATTSSAAQTTASSSSSSSSSSTSAAQTSTTGGGLLDPLTSLLGISSSTTTTSSVPTTTSTSTTASSTSSVVPPTTTQQQAPQTTQQAAPPETTPTLNLATSQAPTATNRGPSVTQVVVTRTEEAAAAASSSAAAKKRTQTITKNTIISLVVIAACIGGAMAIWTVIRKWKLSPSEKFDDRMQPIDWTPPPANGGVTEQAIEEKSKHRRVGSSASHGSFTSGGVPQSDQGHGAKAGMYADPQHAHGYPPQDFPPPHDFTAGATQPGGYGQYYPDQQYAAGPGYADLQRGPSMSESTYSHGAGVSRGLSYSRGHGAYDSQSGAIPPPMPNPYGGEYGYEDYSHPPAGQATQAPQGQAQGQAPYRAF